MHIKNLFSLLKQNEEDLKFQLYKYLIQKKMSSVFEDGFIYAKGNIPILLVAHMDTAFNGTHKIYIMIKFRLNIFNCGGIGSQNAVDKLIRLNVKYIIEFERNGNNDCVFYIIIFNRLDL